MSRTRLPILVVLLGCRNPRAPPPLRAEDTWNALAGCVETEFIDRDDQDLRVTSWYLADRSLVGESVEDFFDDGIIEFRYLYAYDSEDRLIDRTTTTYDDGVEAVRVHEVLDRFGNTVLWEEADHGAKTWHFRQAWSFDEYGVYLGYGVAPGGTGEIEWTVAAECVRDQRGRAISCSYTTGSNQPAQVSQFRTFAWDRHDRMTLEDIRWLEPDGSTTTGLHTWQYRADHLIHATSSYVSPASGHSESVEDRYTWRKGLLAVHDTLGVYGDIELRWHATYSYDAAGRVTRVDRTSSTGSVTVVDVITTVYDDLGRALRSERWSDGTLDTLTTWTYICAGDALPTDTSSTGGPLASDTGGYDTDPTDSGVPCTGAPEDASDTASLKDTGDPGTIDCRMDSDHDGVDDCADRCPGYIDALDADRDGVPEGCDLCPGGDDDADGDADGIPDACDDTASPDTGGT